MPRIATDMLQPGMVLSSDVKDLSGRMLLKSGTEIEGRHLRVLRTWGVLGVEVVGDDNAGAMGQTVSLHELPQGLQAEIEEEVDKRCIGVDTSHPVMAAMVELVKSDLAQKYSSEGQIG